MSYNDMISDTDDQMKKNTKKKKIVGISTGIGVAAVVAFVGIYLAGQKPKEEITFTNDITKETQEAVDYVEVGANENTDEAEAETDVVELEPGTPMSEDQSLAIIADAGVPIEKADYEKYAADAKALENKEAINPAELSRAMLGIAYYYEFGKTGVDEETNKTLAGNTDTLIKTNLAYWNLMKSNNLTQYDGFSSLFRTLRTDEENYMEPIYDLLDNGVLPSKASEDYVFNTIYSICTTIMNDPKFADQDLYGKNYKYVDIYNDFDVAFEDDSDCLADMQTIICSQEFADKYTIHSAFKMTNSFVFKDKDQKGVYAVPITVNDDSRSSVLQAYVAFADENGDVFTICPVNSYGSGWTYKFTYFE